MTSPPDRPVRRGPTWVHALTANPVSVVVLVGCVGVFSVAQLTDPENVRFLAFDSAEWPERWWAMLTYGFVHVEWNHIIVNMLILIWVGVWVERLIGSARFAVLVVASILAGGVTLLVRDTAGIGFSAAAAGVLVYYHFAFPWKRELPLRIPNVVLPVVLIVGSVAAIVFGWFASVGHYPHLAGGAVGVVALAALHRHHRPLDDDTPRPVLDQQSGDR
ncbi:MAG: rhomboid family intramembrane serine protease [Ilumatobacter sp.]|nr:MAG: rhomboid family intramembrane serine protease [Ilumatobacter sp.]